MSKEEGTPTQPLLLPAFFPPKELDMMVSLMKATTMELTKDEAALFDDIEKAYHKLVVEHICRAALMISALRPQATLDDIMYSGTMTMLAMFEMYLRKGQEARKT